MKKKQASQKYMLKYHSTVLLLFPVSRGLLKCFNNKRCCWWTNWYCCLPILDCELHSDFQTFPIWSCLCNIITNFLWRLQAENGGSICTLRHDHCHMSSYTFTLMNGKFYYLQDPRDQSLEPRKMSHPLHHQHISETLKIINHCIHYLLTHVILPPYICTELYLPTFTSLGSNLGGILQYYYTTFYTSNRQ